MRKARVWRTQLKTPAPWRIHIEENKKIVAILDAPSYAEAMFLAQLLVDPHEYLRAAQDKAWKSSKSAARHDWAVWVEHGESVTTTSPYRKVNR